MTDRDANGRFVKGTTGNPRGRMPKAREEKYYEITMSTVTFTDWQVIVHKAAEQAKKGDAVARKWLSDYLVGVPETPLSGGVEILVRYVEADSDRPAEDA